LQKKIFVIYHVNVNFTHDLLEWLSFRKPLKKVVKRLHKRGTYGPEVNLRSLPVTDHHLAELNRFCPSLGILKLDNSRNLSSLAPLTHFTNLQFLEIEGQFDAQDFEVLNNLKAEVSIKITRSQAKKP